MTPSESELCKLRAAHPEGPVKLLQRVKIAFSVLHVISNLSHPIIFNLSG